VNDLALLQVSEPRHAATDRRQAAAIGLGDVAFGDPEGYGLSLVEGIFNGNSEKGLVDWMLLDAAQ
jgi:hypothetical protein